jgi:glycosyltransferase involved in cell wall biosynthesis
MQKKIVYIASNCLSMHSAAVVNIMEMCNAFSKNGFHTTLVVPDCGGDSQNLRQYYGVKYNFDIIMVKLPKIFLRKLIPGLATVFSWLAMIRLKQINYDIIFTRTTWIFALVTLLLRRPCVFEAHQIRFSGKIQSYIYRSLVRLAVSTGHGRIVCISEALAVKWRDNGIDDSCIFVAHDAVNPEKFNQHTSKTKARNLLGLKSSGTIVVYTGSLIAGKGVDVLIKCANRLPEISFLIVGGTDQQIEKLNAAAIFDNVIFTGHVNPSLVPLYQCAADILALPNTRGSLIDDVTSPMKLFEYLASGRPILSSDMPSLLEILKHNYNALISPAGDALELLKNIQDIISTPGLGQLLTDNAKKDLQKYTWDARVNSLKAIFHTP